MRILAVDDDPIIIELLSELLTVIGQHDVETAESAIDALKIVQNPAHKRFDCILLDIQMPGMTGIELAAKLREMPDYARIPILMITAMSDKTYIDRAFAAGATDYITKPFDIDEVRFRIKSAEQRLKDAGGMTRKIFSVNKLRQQTPATEKVALNEPVTIFDVDGVIDYFAFENYVTQLSRSSMFGSTVFGIAIREIDKLYRESTAFGFECLITDTSEAISDCLKPNNFLIAYAGNGTFLCVLEGGARPDLERLVDAINLTLHQMDLYFCDGRKLDFRVCAGQPQRLIWRAGKNAMEAVIAAHESAESEALKREKMLNDFWITEQAG
ncbi:MAG: response regulator [Pseudooceanicola sp.]|nr:response regulator [Pseudooceanicola sp.]